MHTRPRFSVPPYQVMRRAGGMPSPAREPRTTVGPEKSSAPMGPVRGVSLANRLSEPVILRMSYGLAALLATGMLVMLVLAFWIGLNRGERAVLTKLEGTPLAVPTGVAAGGVARVNAVGQPAASAGVSSGAATAVKPVTPALGAGATAATGVKPVRVAEGADPRVVGKSYLHLVSYSAAQKEMALTRLQQLLSKGVEAAVIRGHNGGFLLIALPGFGPGEIAASRPLKQRCSQILAIAESGPVLREFNGEPAVEVITKENLP